MRRWLVLIWVFLTALPVVATAQEYRLQPGDRIDISVLEDPTLDRSVLIGPDGRISLPLVGTIIAAEQTTTEVASALRNRLAREFVELPTVTVALTGLAKSLDELLQTRVPIYIIGQVGNPGVYQVNLPMDLLQALALAGGPGTFAARKRIQVRRRLPDGGETVLLFNYEDLERGNVPSNRINLLENDVIVVPERRFFE